jgi:hypothetical protein
MGGLISLVYGCHPLMVPNIVSFVIILKNVVKMLLYDLS